MISYDTADPASIPDNPWPPSMTEEEITRYLSDQQPVFARITRVSDTHFHLSFTGVGLTHIWIGTETEIAEVFSAGLRAILPLPSEAHRATPPPGHRLVPGLMNPLAVPLHGYTPARIASEIMDTFDDL